MKKEVGINKIEYIIDLINKMSFLFSLVSVLEKKERRESNLKQGKR